MYNRKVETKAEGKRIKRAVERVRLEEEGG